MSSSADKTIRVWNTTTGDCTAILKQHQHWVWSLTQDLNQRILLSSSQDDTIKAWNLETEACLKTLRCLRPYEGTMITGATGLTEVQRVTLQALGTIEGVLLTESGDEFVKLNI